VDIRRIARELASAETAACYARIGTCTQEFGTVASWLVDVVNVLTGNLDRPGGAMFTRAAAGARNTSGRPGIGRGVRISRWQSRVRGLPEAFGELPVAALAEEIETPGEGQVRALVTYAGNPARSTPNSARLERAIGRLEFMVSVDIYLNETTRHADVILPGSSPLERSHYDIGLYQLAVRNVANFSSPLFEPAAGRPRDWQIMLRLAGIFGGQGADADLEALDRFVAGAAVAEAAKGDGALATAIPRTCLPRSSRATAPSACSTCCSGPAPTERASAWRTEPTMAASRSKSSSRARTGSISDPWSLAFPRSCGQRRARSSSPRPRSSRTWTGCADGLRPATDRSC
jgi:anaerobic selenocysteine-containing dehydrogenase